MVAKWKGEVIGEVDGAKLGERVRWCEVGSVDDGLLRGAGTKSGRSCGPRPLC